MANGSRKGAIIVRASHGKSAPRNPRFRPPIGQGNKPSLLYTQVDHSWRSRELIRWPRGFKQDEEPLDRNEWTRGRGLWYNGPR